MPGATQYSCAVLNPAPALRAGGIHWLAFGLRDKHPKVMYVFVYLFIYSFIY